MFPDFIGIGAQKAGTTWLHHNLREHPGVYMPRKEVHYFDKKFGDGSSAAGRLFGRRDADRRWRRQVRNWAVTHLVKQPSLWNLFYDFKYLMGTYNDTWYASLFEPRRGRVAGEITPAYSTLDREAVSHVHGLMPEAKIIFMMRNPIERAWSQAVMSFDNVERGSARFAPEDIMIRRVERDSSRLLTGYLRTLENWGEYYPEEQIFVGFLEDVHFFPEELLDRLYGFLGLEPYPGASLSREKVHSRSVGCMPAGVAVHLANSYREEAERLRGRFGGYAAFWRYSAQRLIEDPPREETVPYPLWESRMWDEWREFNEVGLQSGPLAAGQAVG